MAEYLIKQIFSIGGNFPLPKLDVPSLNRFILDKVLYEDDDNKTKLQLQLLTDKNVKRIEGESLLGHQWNPN